jgi:tetratricopeptide (TPR) repeat protein
MSNARSQNNRQLTQDCSTMNRKFSTTALALTLLICSTAPIANAEAAKKAVPDGSLTAEFIYKFLIAEIAGQRGDVNTAGAIMYELAKTTGDARLANRATQAALYTKQGGAAMRAATLWADLDPTSVEAREILTQLTVASGKISELRPHLQKILSHEENRPSGFLYITGLLSRSEDKAGVLKLVQEVTKPYATIPEARLALAHAAWGAGKEQLALDELQAADNLRPGWEIGALLHGQIVQSRPAEAMQFYHHFLDSYPDALEVRLAYAKLLVNEKQFDAARKEFDKLIQANPNNAEVHVAIGLLSVQLEDASRAENHFKQALELNYKDPDQLYFYLGQIAEQTQQFEDAQRWYDTISPESRFHFDTQLKSAVMQARQGQLDAARQRLQALTNLSPEQQAAAIQTEAGLLSQAGRHKEAFDLLQQAVETLPNSADLIYDYAMVAERVQRFDIMEQQLRKLIQLKPDFAQAYNALGYTLADRNERLDEAQALIEKALSLTPDDHFILDSMGWVHYRLGRLDQALDFIRRAYEVRSDPEIAAHLGEVLWQQGHKSEALSTWENALHDFPTNEVLVNTSKKFKQ